LAGFISGERVQFLSSALPEASIDELRFILGIERGDVDKASTFFLDGIRVCPLLAALKYFIIDEEEEPREIAIDGLADAEKVMEKAVAYYQGDDWDWRADVKIRLSNSVTIDEGGVRRQFFDTVLGVLKAGLFEGPPNRLRPTFKQSSIKSGALFTMGKIIGQSIVLDGQGFPFLSPSCYWCMVGRMDRALATLSAEDAGEKVSRAVLKVRVWEQ
jgi:hypothetical protein